VIAMLDRFPVHAILPSQDLERSKAWWAEKVGMKPAREDMGGAWFECADGTWIGMVQTPNAGTAKNTALSFQVTGIESLMEDLRARGVVFEDYDMGPDFKTKDGLLEMGGYKAAWFVDSEGNIIEIAQLPS
jgi:catechol 2,3-dioxygenase-like lactoylglutathione lyase family enzyme